MKKIIASLIITVVYACSSDPEKAIEKTEQPINKDTTISLIVNKVRVDYTIKKSIRINFKDFQDFLNEYAGKKLELNDTIQEDVTGDGNKDKVITRIKTIDDNYFIYATIYDKDSLIYTDTLKIQEDYTFQEIWDRDSVYFKLKPYSNFYIALFNRYIIDDLNPKYDNYNYWIDFFMENQKNKMIESGIDTTLIRTKLDSTKYELTNYKGKLIFSMHQLDRDVYIWDRNKKKFVDFYQP